MTPLRVLLARLLRRGRRQAALNHEIEHHLALLAAQFVQRGMSIEAACEAARREFGGLEQMKEAYRDQGGLTWLEDLGQDARYAGRTLLRNPGFAAVAILTLALGIGANSAIFSVVNSVLLKPLPYPDSERLVQQMMTVPAGDASAGAAGRRQVALSISEIAEIQSQTNVLSHIGTASPELVGLSGREDAARLQGARVSSSALQMVAARPVLGRIFTRQDEMAGAEPVILIANSAWQRYFGGDRNVLGRSLTLTSVLGPRRQSRYTVVGVMPDGFEFPGADNQFWMPFQPPAAAGRGGPRGPMLGKLAEGVSLEAATSELAPVVRALRQGQRGNDLATYELVRMQDELVASVGPALRVLTVAVGFVLLIACINVMHLLLARNAARQREMAIRLALGAGRGRVVRLLLTESLLLATVASVLGVVFAHGGVRLFRALAATSARFDLGVARGFPRLHEVAVDGPVLVFTAVTAVITAVVFGLAPAIRQSRPDAVRQLREGGGSIGSGLSRLSVRTVLVIAEVAAAMILLVNGGLLVRSFANLLSVNTGYDASSVLTFQVSLPMESYPDERLKGFSEDLVARLEGLPGIEGAAYANQLPMVQLRDSAGGLWRTPDAQRGPSPDAPDARLISRDYLQVMGVRVVTGRGFLDIDGEGRPRALLINQALARRDFTGQDPIGQLVYVGRDAVPWQIVGVVDDVRQFGLDQDPQPQFFIDVRQWPSTAGVLFPIGAYYAIRTSGDPMAAVPQIRGAIGDIDPQAALFNTAPMEELVATTTSRPRMYAVLLGIFAAVGVGLAVIGIYGLMAYSVAQRTREIGVRTALGASRRSVLGLVLGQSLVLTGVGILIGLAGAGALSRYLESLLFGITPADVSTYAAVAALFAAVAASAALVPAHRATKIEPLTALRYE